MSQYGGKQCPEVGEDLADVVTAAAENGKDGIAERAFERASGEAAIGFHVADLRFNGTAAFEEFRQDGRKAAPGTADQHAGGLYTVSAPLGHSRMPCLPMDSRDQRPPV